MSREPTSPGGRGARSLPVEPGQVLGEYVVEGMIARGGFGTVYSARHRSSDRAVAVKVLHADLVVGDAIARFHREAEVLRQVDHPSLVAIEAIGELPSGVPYFVMELLAGHDLEAELAVRRRFAPHAALEVLRPLASVLAAAHAVGVIHRDVKASNVVFDPRRARSPVVLLDFGIAKLLDTGAGLTATRQLVGSPCCNSPEQLEGGPIDARTDVYGLAVLAFQLLTGDLPFRLDEVGQLQHLVAPRPRASTRGRLVPAFDRVLARGMAIDPRDRPAGPVELVDELGAAAASQTELESLSPVRCEIEAMIVHALPIADLDETIIGELALLARSAEAWLVERGFVLVRERDETSVYARRLGAGPAVADGVAREVASVLRARASSAVRIAAVARRGRAECVGGVLWASALLDDA
jgi:serine/threonine-protein kinase